jgi:hypothetical protein
MGVTMGILTDFELLDSQIRESVVPRSYFKESQSKGVQECYKWQLLTNDLIE